MRVPVIVLVAVKRTRAEAEWSGLVPSDRVLLTPQRENIESPFLGPFWGQSHAARLPIRSAVPLLFFTLLSVTVGA